MLDSGAIEKGGDHLNGRQGAQSEVQHRIVLPQIPIVAAGFTVADQLLTDFSCEMRIASCWFLDCLPMIGSSSQFEVSTV